MNKSVSKITNTVLTEALRLRDTGLNLLPIRTDGSKSPAMATWKRFIENRASEEDVRMWLGGAPRGVAVVCGATSGNLVVVDGDAADFEAVDALLAEFLDPDAYALWRAAPRVRTGSGAWHVYLRGEQSVQGQVLAARPLEVPEGTPGAILIGNRWVKKDVKVETRGHGQIAVTAPSPKECHPDRRPYVLEAGDLASIPVLTRGQLDAVFALCATLDTWVDPERPVSGAVNKKASQKAAREGALFPGDDFNRRGDHAPLLEGAGWKLWRTFGDNEYWTRPGKEKGVSGTFTAAVPGHDCGLFRCFTSSDACLKHKRAYSPFGLFAALKHGGDHSAAGRELYAQGFGDRVARDADGDGDTPEDTSQPVDDTRTGGGDAGADLPHVLPSAARRLAGLPVRVVTTGLRLSPDATEAERQRVFKRLFEMADGAQKWLRFAIGDAYNGVAPTRGEREKWVRRNFGEGHFQAISNYGWVAGRWGHERRDMSLPWSFFVEAADRVFGVTDQDELAARWRRGGLTVEELRRIKREKKGGTPKGGESEPGVKIKVDAGNQTLHQGVAAGAGPEGLADILPDGAESDLRFILGAAGPDYLRAVLAKAREALADASPTASDAGSDLFSDTESWADADAPADAAFDAVIGDFPSEFHHGAVMELPPTEAPNPGRNRGQNGPFYRPANAAVSDTQRPPGQAHGAGRDTAFITTKEIRAESATLPPEGPIDAGSTGWSPPGFGPPPGNARTRLRTSADYETNSYGERFKDL